MVIFAPFLKMFTCSHLSNAGWEASRSSNEVYDLLENHVGKSTSQYCVNHDNCKGAFGSEFLFIILVICMRLYYFTIFGSR